MSHKNPKLCFNPYKTDIYFICYAFTFFTSRYQRRKENILNGMVAGISWI